MLRDGGRERERAGVQVHAHVKTHSAAGTLQLAEG